MKRSISWLLGLVVLIAAVAAPAVLAVGPTGAGPSDPLLITGASQTIAANARLWFYFDYTGDKSRIYAYLDDNGASNVELGIYTPQQAADWLNDQSTVPIGRGTPPGSNTSDASHDLIWVGSFSAPGRYFAVVTNHNASPVSFRLLVRGDNVALGPTPTPTQGPVFANPYATPVPTGTLQGRLIFQEGSGGNIYSVNGDGTDLKRITYGIDPAWSPDGKRITFTRWDQPAGIFVASADGTNEQMVFRADNALSPQWNPDNAHIVFTRISGGKMEETKIVFGRFSFTLAPDPHWKLAVVDVNTGDLGEPKCSYHCFSPTWSRDGQSIVYADAGFGILSADPAPDGAVPTNLFTQNPGVQSTAFSPDGTKIAFQVRQADHWQINWMNADGGNVTAVTFDDPLGFKVVSNVAPNWSPDGKQILFLSNRNGKWEFFVVNLDGSGLTQVLKNITDTMTIRYNYSNERVVDWIK